MDILINTGWYALLIAMAGDLVISLLLPVFYRGYSVPKMSISALGNPQSPVRLQCRRGAWLEVEFIPSGDGFKDVFLTGPAELIEK